MAFIALIGVMVLTYIFLPQLFPYPDKRLSEVSPKEYEDSRFKVMILHHLVYSGVFLLGSQMIYSKSFIYAYQCCFLFSDNGKAFCDDATRQV